ncbi:MAG: hypothetical protein KC462_03020, partial [Cyanobacteria bacterium HKST-UBA05]|nr:hypothetical protein [Cyanobacteria bacterium HKST-UBA05]
MNKNRFLLQPRSRDKSQRTRQKLTGTSGMDVPKPEVTPMPEPDLSHLIPDPLDRPEAYWDDTVYQPQARAAQYDDDGEGGIVYMDMRYATALSTLAHIVTPIGVLLASILVMILLGIDWMKLFVQPEPEVKDIEFVIASQPEAPPIDKHTKIEAM